MGFFLAKLKGSEEFFKLKDQVEFRSYTSICLDDAMVYDPNNEMAHQWFKLEHFSNHDAFLDNLMVDYSAAELQNISRTQYDSIAFVAYYDGTSYFIQKVAKSSYMNKAWISFSGNCINYQQDQNLIFLNPIPSCIYNRVSDCLYFMDISKAYSVFDGVVESYRSATATEVSSFLNSEMIATVNYNESNVGIANRKRIAKVMSVYSNYTNEQKDCLRNYINNSLPNQLAYDSQSGKFTISDDKQLRLLLYGIQMRFYATPLNPDEVQVATNTTSISNIM
jgi:hypothetical protein